MHIEDILTRHWTFIQPWPAPAWAIRRLRAFFISYFVFGCGS